MNIRDYPNNSLSFIKLFAVLSMVVDHYNKYLKVEYSQILFNFGRLALPLFIFVIGYNLARMPVKKMPTMMIRLLLFGLASVPAYNALGGAIALGWWPLNVLYTLLASVAVVYLLSLYPDGGNSLKRVGARVMAVIVFVASGVVVEYFWPALGLVVAVWAFFRLAKKPLHALSVLPLLGLGLLLLCDLNGNGWALLALPVIALGWMVSDTGFQMPRFKWFFYWFYPAHLWLLYLVSTLK